jgi:hypothetical protein
MATTCKSGIRLTKGVTNLGLVKEVQLPNGRKIGLLSRDGANDFVDAVGTDFISTNVFTTAESELMAFYVTITSVTEGASPEKLASGIPESELLTFIEHALNTLDTISIDRNWLRSGTLPLCYEMFLRTVACFVKHPSFLRIFLSNEGMEAVAKFYASRKKNNTPSQSVAQFILLFVNNTLRFLEQDGIFLEKSFVIMEKTGLLGQFIRCVAVDVESSDDIVRALLQCVQVVKKKLKSGTPTGDILDAVIAGKDGPINEKAKSSLAKLQSLARLSNDNYNNVRSVNLRMCRHCDKSEILDGAKIMSCQRCKVAYYCNRECQVADWKIHKKMCKAISNSPGSHSAHKTFNTTMWAFIMSNYFDIAREVYKKTQEFNVPKKKLMVEINFFEDAPALRNEFKVWLASGFFEGSSVTDAPDWIRTNAKDIRGDYELVTSDDLLVVCRGGNGQVKVNALHFVTVKTGCELLSDETVESIGREDYARMVACLGQDTTDKYFREKMSGLR